MGWDATWTAARRATRLPWPVLVSAAVALSWSGALRADDDGAPEPTACPAGDRLQLEATAEGVDPDDLSYSWECHAEWLEECGLFDNPASPTPIITCPTCPEPTGTEPLNVAVRITDDQGNTTWAFFEMEVLCDAGGCGCDAARSAPPGAVAAALALGASVLARRRRRRPR